MQNSTLATRMTATMGSLHEFRPDSEDLSTYLERVEIFFTANDVSTEKKVPVLLNAVGGTTYALLRSLLAPASPMTKTLDELTATLRAHFEPKPSLITERFHFHKRDQAAGESIADYVAELRRLASRCSFPTDYLDETLQDRFVCGLRSDRIQTSLLSLDDMSLTNVVTKAMGLETAYRDAQALKQSSAGSLSVARVSGSSITGRPPMRRSSNDSHAARRKPCYRCGQTGHTAQDCNFKNAACHKCGKNSHIAKVCRGGGKPHNEARSGGKATRWVDKEELEGVSSGVNSVEDHLYNVYTLGPGKPHPYQVAIQLDGKEIAMEIDTGAAVSIISEVTLKKHFPRAVLEKPTISLRKYMAKPIPVLGEIFVMVEHKGYKGSHTLYVVGGNGPSLLGRDWLGKIRIDWAGIRAITSSENKLEVESLLSKYPQIFQPGLGTMTEVRAHLSLKPDTQPRFCRPRTVPYAIKEKVGKELDRLEEEGVLHESTTLTGQRQ